MQTHKTITHFTHKEKTVKNINVSFIIKQVRDVLNDKKITGMCVNKLPDDYKQLYTVEQASKIIEEVIDDSIFYNY